MKIQIDLSEEQNFALNLIQEAGKILKHYFSTGVTMSMKLDNSPVTVADKECEKFLRDSIAKVYANDLILGEEEGLSKANTSISGNKRKWIIDPLDGTYNFARGISVFSILLALEIEGEIYLGLVHNPVLEETYYAYKGSGAFKNGQPVKVSNIDQIEKSLFLYGGTNRILESGHWQTFTSIVQKSYRQRSFGDYLNFAYVFEGKAEATIEFGLQPWDLAPMKVIVEEAGGKYADLGGNSSIYTGNCLVTNHKIHEAYLRLFEKA